jgi:hypothetical protein
MKRYDCMIYFCCGVTRLTSEAVEPKMQVSECRSKPMWELKHRIPCMHAVMTMLPDEKNPCTKR